MITYRCKATKISKRARKALQRAAKRATRYYNSLLAVSLAHFDSTHEVLAANPLKKLSPKEKDLPTYHSEPVVERVVAIMKRYASGEFGRPRFKSVQRARWSLAITVYTQVSHKVILSCGDKGQSVRISVPGTDITLNLRTDKRDLKGEIKRLSVVGDGCGDIWVNITTDAELPFVVGKPRCQEMRVDQGCREYAVAVGFTEDNSVMKLSHERSLSDVTRETSRLENAQRNCDWRGVKHIHRRIERKRKDFNHRLACELVRKSAILYIGDVPSRFLFANPHSKIARKAADACHAQLRSFVGQKAARATEPREAYLVRESYTSKTCSYCGEENDIGALKFWECHRCRTWHDRDVNAAINMRFCRITEDLAQNWRKQSDKYHRMRVIRKQPRKKDQPLRRAMTPVGTPQNVCAPGEEVANTAEFASLSIH